MDVAAELPRRPLGRYSYPTSHRVIELLSIGTFVVLMVVFAGRVIGAVTGEWGIGTAFGVLAAGFAGFVGADFASGLVHGLCDNLGSERTPIVGQKFIRSFREHHVDPLDMTTGDYVRTNADNYFASLFVLVPSVIWMDVVAHPYRGAFVVSLLVVVIMTNQIHKWAHLVHVGRPVPAPVRWLQRSHVILSPDHHQIHHTPPYDTHYCITSGITNGPLARIGFWPVMMRTCRAIGRHLPGSPAITGDQGPGTADATVASPDHRAA